MTWSSWSRHGMVAMVTPWHGRHGHSMTQSSWSLHDMVAMVTPWSHPGRSMTFVIIWSHHDMVWSWSHHDGMGLICESELAVVALKMEPWLCVLKPGGLLALFLSTNQEGAFAPERSAPTLMLK
eukprot:scaffold225696_cov19-Tisochrysis_lutea.AAC.4